MAEEVKIKFVVDDADGQAKLNKLADKLSDLVNKDKGLPAATLGFGNLTKAIYTANIATKITEKAFDKIKETLKKAWNSTIDLTRAFNEINSILPKNQKLTEAVKDEMRELSKQYGTSSQNQAKAFYTIVSSGIEDTAIATDILKQANLAALAGQGDVNDVARVLTSTLNAYASTTLDAATATDILFKAVDDGAINFSELTTQLGRALPSAAALKVPFDELVGSIAFLSRQGFTTEQSVTSIATVLNSVLAPSKEATDQFKLLGGAFKGLDLNADTINKLGGFKNFIKELVDAAGGREDILVNIFGDQRAVKAILSINTQLGDFNKVLDNVKNSSGAAKAALSEFDEDPQLAIDKLASTWNDFWISFITGTRLVRGMTNVFQYLYEVMNPPKVDDSKKSTEELNQEIAKLNQELEVLQGSFKTQTIQNEIRAVKERILELRREVGYTDLQVMLNPNGMSQEIMSTGKPGAYVNSEEPKKKSSGKGAKTVAEQEAEKEAERQKYKNIEIEAQYMHAERLSEIQDSINKNELEQIVAKDEQKLNLIKEQQELELEQFALQQEQLRVAEEARIALIEDSTQRELELRNLRLKQSADAQKFIGKQEITAKKEEKKNSDEVQKEKYQTYAKYTSATADLIGGFAALSAAAGEKNFKQTQALQLAMVPIQTAAAILNIMAQTAGNPVLMGIQIAAATALGIAQMMQIANAQPPKKYAQGGIEGVYVGSKGMSGDQNLAYLNSREMILPMNEQIQLFNSIKSGSFGGNGEITNTYLERIAIAAERDNNTYLDVRKVNNELQREQQRLRG